MASKNRYRSSSSSKSNGSWGILPGWHTSEEEMKTKPDSLLLSMNDGTRDFKGRQPWSSFDRFYSIDLKTELPSGRHYIFMCRPDLYLVEDGSATSSEIRLSTESRVNVDPYFTYLASFHPEIIGSLTGDFAGLGALKSVTQKAVAESGYGNSKSTDGTKVKIGNSTKTLPIHAFIPIITSRVESLQLPDYTIKQNTIVQPYTKYTVPYTTSAIESSTGGSFDITFREDKYYSIHKLFYAWIYYQNNVMRNIFSPKLKYIQFGAMDYATSIYDFVVDDTGENVIYWAKYTGCIPTSVPMSDLSFNRNSGAETKVSIPFSYFYCEHMDRNILLDFQYNSLGYITIRNYMKNKNPLNAISLSSTVPIYDSDTFLGANFVGRPVLFYGSEGSENRSKKSSEPYIKLRWLPE